MPTRSSETRATAAVTTDGSSERRSIVCEGFCNPNLAHLDRKVKDYRKIEGMEVHRGRLPMYDEHILAGLKRLKHTIHERRSKNNHEGRARWVCTECGHERTL